MGALADDSESAVSASTIGSLRVIRMVRLVRVLRVLRVARIVRFLTALRMLFIQIIGTLKSVFWAMVLLVLIVYTFGMVFAQASSDYLAFTAGDELSRDDIVLKRYYGTVPR